MGHLAHIFITNYDFNTKYCQKITDSSLSRIISDLHIRSSLTFITFNSFTRNIPGINRSTWTLTFSRNHWKSWNKVYKNFFIFVHSTNEFKSKLFKSNLCSIIWNALVTLFNFSNGLTLNREFWKKIQNAGPSECVSRKKIQNAALHQFVYVSVLWIFFPKARSVTLPKMAYNYISYFCSARHIFPHIGICHLK